MKKLTSLLILFVLTTFPAFGQGNSAESAGVSARSDVSPAWRTIAVTTPVTKAPRQVPNKVPFNLRDRAPKEAKLADPLRQPTQFGSTTESLTPSPMSSFEGLSDDDNAAITGGRIVPPDTQGDVGTNYYVQWINSLLAVYSKSTGNLVFGPVAGNSIWTGFGGACETNNDGDPIVLFDHLAQRWMISQFAVANDGHECIAISTTSDPAGSYFRYDFVVSPGALNDYPKFGVWNDAYYMTANEFAGSGGSGGFDGVIAVAFERDQMLAGLPAQFVKFGPLPCTNSFCPFTVLPSHLEGPAVAAGQPNVHIMAWDDAAFADGSGPDGYRLWEFSVDWATPSASSFTQIPFVTSASFDANLCGFNRNCIPQPKGKNRGETLDPASSSTMYRAQFRHFTDRDSIVLNHTVDASGSDQAGIRWAELRRDAGGWFLHQAGTYSPDGEHRWMGSIAMDGEGNIALGYNVSSTSTFPSLRYVTRNATDALGQMPGGEVELIAGGGAQQNSFNRWGDYSTMSVDPVDDCTFWFTGEYYANNGSFDFKTRIGSFNVCDQPVCTVTEPGTELTCNDALDNDCDGFVDLDDSDCDTGGTCTLGQSGDTCSVDADCCSNKCKGGANKTCKG